MVVFFTDLGLMEFQVRYLALFLLFSVIEGLRVVLDGKSSEERLIIGPTLFLLFINDFPDDVICHFAIYAYYTALYSKYDQASDLW